MRQQVEAAEVQTVGDLFASGQLQWLEARRAYEVIDRLSGADGSDDFVLDEFASALEQFEALGGYAVEQRIEEIKSGLGITRNSAGPARNPIERRRKTRVSLGALLLSDATVLLLDEPTNYLDLPALLWLEAFIRDSPLAMIVVSHDRES